ncbi:hypothetical protein BDU57DRAFT_516084 [Ampelomyces quisqualis]|uniref:Mtf2-like C-terminal domain-containing protein n=1 Tax=Ampelomyces quisqualis TaxID=50730 RepID=A0A6A5QKM9_AMPQU|nr:hypothetical protein BDU57DRAFT_516084 [Ampelomyces quisqualis]
MSLCSHTARAISRSRITKPNTLLPFLYQTATIQQWQPCTRAIARRTISSRSRPQDDWPVVEDVPFHDAEGNLPPRAEEAQSTRKTTMTSTERAAFEKLYKTLNAQVQERKTGQHVEYEELEQIADTYYKDDENDASGSLDKVFNEVLQRSPLLLPTQRNGKYMTHTPRPSGTVSSGASASIPDTPQNKKKLAAKAENERIKKLRLEERERIDKLMKGAQTDRDLWEILNREVFDPLRKLNLDETNPSSKEETKPKGPKPRTKTTSVTASEQTRILFPNFPDHILTAVQLLRINFPRSSLSLTILPTIKSLGRSSFALGATPQLYKHLLRTAWIQQSSYTLIDNLLTDMDANLVEFDIGILDVIDGVIREHEMGVSGQLGKELQLLFGMETWAEGISKIVAWRRVVAKKLGVNEEAVQTKLPQNVQRDQPRDGPRSTRFFRKTFVSDRMSMRAKGTEPRPPRADRRRHAHDGEIVDDFVPLLEGRQPADGGASGARLETTTPKDADKAQDEQKTAGGASDAPKVLL